MLSVSREEAIRLGDNLAGSEHLLLAMIKEKDILIIKVLDSLKVDIPEFKNRIEEHSLHKSASTETDELQFWTTLFSLNFDNKTLDKQTQKTLKDSYSEAKLIKFKKSTLSICYYRF